jgi:flagellar protein FliO/FliZ
MGFIDRIFGTELGLPARAIVALGLVLALIMLTVWLMRRFGNGGIASGASGRNRQQRLSVLDSAPVDARRRLVLIRRDNLEHLLLIGGPTDVVVEANIMRGAMPSQSRMQAPSRSGVFDVTEEQPETPLSPASFAEPIYNEPVRQAPPAPAPIPFRPVQEAPRPMAPPAPMAAPAQLPPIPPRPAPAPRAPEPAPYSDMAKRLEEALRNPAQEAPAPRAPMPPSFRAAEPVRAPEPRVFAPQQQGRAPMRAPEPRTAPQPQQSAADVFGSLEDEMASLLRPGGKTTQ